MLSGAQDERIFEKLDKGNAKIIDRGRASSMEEQQNGFSDWKVKERGKTKGDERTGFPLAEPRGKLGVDNKNKNKSKGKGTQMDNSQEKAAAK